MIISKCQFKLEIFSWPSCWSREIDNRVDCSWSVSHLSRTTQRSVRISCKSDWLVSSMSFGRSFLRLKLTDYLRTEVCQLKQCKSYVENSWVCIALWMSQEATAMSQVNDDGPTDRPTDGIVQQVATLAWKGTSLSQRNETKLNEKNWNEMKLKPLQQVEDVLLLMMREWDELSWVQ